MIQHYNRTKARKATPNEIAKYLIIDLMDEIFIYEKYGCDELSEKEFNEVQRHFDKHKQSILSKLFPNNDYIVVQTGINKSIY